MTFIRCLTSVLCPITAAEDRLNPVGTVLVIASVAIGGAAGSASAAPQVDVEHAILGEAALLMGDCGSTIAQQSAGAAEFETGAALDRATQVLAVGGEYTSMLAQGLRHLCEVEGMSTCEAAGVCEGLSVDLALAGEMIGAQDLKSASAHLASAAAAYRDIFSFETNGAIPEELQKMFVVSAASLDRASAMLSVLANPAAFNAAVAYPLEAHASGLDAMLGELNEPAEYGWPAGFLSTECYVGGNYVGKWANGTVPATQLARLDAQAVLDGWLQRGTQGSLELFGGAAVLHSLHGFGANMRDSMYGLRSMILNGLVVDGPCTFECQNDDDCGGCRIAKTGVGLAYYNPEELDEARLVVDLLLEIDVTRRGISLTPEALRDAVSSAFSDLIDKLIAKSGHLYILMERNRCIFSRCFIFWEESDCVVTKSEWVKVPLPILQELTPVKMWRSGEWKVASKAATRAANDWCRQN
ncbi:MAG: hypothetical protein LW806_04810 [Planctomycetaceae bacterium]|nr:hypothetical protein [Planctomycetaceae bacterium]